MLLRNAQSEQRWTDCRRPSSARPSGKASKHSLGFLPGADPSAAGGSHLGTGPQLINQLNRPSPVSCCRRTPS